MKAAHIDSNAPARKIGRRPNRDINKDAGNVANIVATN